MYDIILIFDQSFNNFDLVVVIFSFYFLDIVFVNFLQVGRIKVLFGVIGVGFIVSQIEFIFLSLSFVEIFLMFILQIKFIDVKFIDLFRE